MIYHKKYFSNKNSIFYIRNYKEKINIKLNT